MTGSCPHPNDREQGFVLLSVIWLLVLAGAVIGYLTIRAHDLSREAKVQAAFEQERLTLEGAIDVLVADRIVNGANSRWSRASAQGSIPIDGETISITSTGEGGRLDLLSADPAYVERALQGLGLQREERTMLLGRLALARSSGRKSIGLLELRSMLGDAGASSPCLLNLFTSFSHMPQPLIDQMPGELARALAIPMTGGNRESMALLAPGAPQRIEARTSKGMTLTTVVRVIGQAGQGYQTLDWMNGRACPD